MLNCDTFDHRLHELLDQRCPLTDQRLRQHASECEKCNRIIDAYDRMFEGLAAPVPVPLADNFAQQVVARVLEGQEAVPRKSASRRLGIGLLIAASLLLVILPWVRSFWTERGVTVAPVEARPKELIGGDTDFASDPNVEYDSNGEYAMTESTGGIFDPTIVLQEPWRSIVARISRQMEFDQDRFQQVTQFTARLEPIRISLDAALDTLRNTIPIGRSTRTTPTSSESARRLDPLTVAIG